MIKRFVIAAIIVGLFLGGVGYFNLVFKPKMIAEFMSKMVPPPATVTTEVAKTEKWVDRLRAIGTLVAIEGVDVAPQLGGMVTDYYFDSGQGRREGRKARQARHHGRRGRPRRQQGDADPGQSRLRAPGEAGEDRRGVAGGAGSNHRQARFRRGGGAACRGDHHAKDHRRAVRRQARTSACGEGAICFGGPGSGLAASARPDLGRLSRG